jgi:hypothetical protein
VMLVQYWLSDLAKSSVVRARNMSSTSAKRLVC